MTGGAYEAATAAVGATIAAVTADSPAARAGLAAGDEVLHVDGSRVRDLIDWQWMTAEHSFVVTVRRDGGELAVPVRRAWDEPVGVMFSAMVFDGVRTCENACMFCFVAQLPGGMRPSLMVRDDDIRLSFLAGTFVTLTNVTDEDVARVIDQRLSPLYVSVHAVDPDVRRRLVCPTVEDRALERIDELTAAGIELHVQIVLVPGVNDGDVLDGTLAWLAEREAIGSVGVVPLGFTAHQTRFSESYGEPTAAAAVLARLEPWRWRMRQERGVNWVHAADELYLAARRDIPPADTYDGFPQYENGIGLVRAFVDEWDDGVALLPAGGGVASTAITGGLFAPVLDCLLADARERGHACAVLGVPNRLFAGNVSVAGLLAGADIAAVVAQADGEGPFFVPDVVLNEDGVTLDGWDGARLVAATGKDVRVVSSDAAGLLTALTEHAAPRTSTGRDAT